MRVKTGETATSALNVDIQYRCSSCGNENLAIETIEGTAYTATILGVNLDRNIAGQAREDLERKLNTVLDQKNPQRFRAVKFACTCKQCGYAEPWARMNYSNLDRLNVVSLCILGFSCVVAMAGAYESAINLARVIMMLIAVASLAACIGINIYKNKNNQKMEELIAKLPQESLPRISIYSEELHNTFGKSTTQGASAEATYDKWVCSECGTQNSTKYGQCKKCGKYKSS